MKDFLIFFTRKLRLSNPWNYKVPFLISLTYLLLYLNNYLRADIVYSFLASLCIIVGVAGVGYLSNDLGDRKKDQLIQKENATAHISALSIAALFLLFFTLAIAPWFYLPFNTWSVVLLSAQFALFFMYALPPFRLKEKGFPGLVCDTLYAHVIPAVLASLTFQLFAGNHFHHFICFLLITGTWQFFLGLRNIIFHQLKDAENDQNSGTRTFVTNVGINSAENLIKKILLPAEILSFLVFAAFITRFMLAFAIFIVAVWILLSVLNRKNRPHRNYRSFAYVYLDDLYMKWLPLLIAAALCWKTAYALPVLAIHFVIFRSQLKTWICQLLKINV